MRLGRLRILMACPPVGNPYITQLINTLSSNSHIESVRQGLSWLGDPRSEFDVVHVQWPEALCNWREPSENQLREIEQVILRWKKSNTAIVTTVHNLRPHNASQQSTFSQLYRLVYAQSSAFIHLGEASKSLVGSEYRDVTQQARHFVIPHGNYDYFKQVAVTAAPQAPFPRKSKFNVLSIGQIRSEAEIALLADAGACLEQINGSLIIAGRIDNSSKKKYLFYKRRIPLWRRPNVKLIERFIADEQIQNFIKPAHAIFIPRLASLNSGNVALGFTFAKVVVGPQIGVIGEELNCQGNPTFEPGNYSSLFAALTRAKMLCLGNLGRDNESYAQESLHWENVSKAHVASYEWAYKHAQSQVSGL